MSACCQSRWLALWVGGFAPHARSPKGALGLMQVMPAIAHHLANLARVANAGDHWLLTPPQAPPSRAWVEPKFAPKALADARPH